MHVRVQDLGNLAARERHHLRKIVLESEITLNGVRLAAETDGGADVSPVRTVAHPDVIGTKALCHVRDRDAAIGCALRYLLIYAQEQGLPQLVV